jgi:hypothetical protein
MTDANRKAGTGRWLLGLTAIAILVTFLGIAVILVLSGGP